MEIGHTVLVANTLGYGGQKIKQGFEVPSNRKAVVSDLVRDCWKLRRLHFPTTPATAPQRERLTINRGRNKDDRASAYGEQIIGSSFDC